MPKITLVGGPYTVGDEFTYGPGEVDVPDHIAAVLERMDAPAVERAAAEREAKKAERAATKAAEERAAARKGGEG